MDELLHNVLPGELFNQYFFEVKFYTLTYVHDSHNFVTGLNEHKYKDNNHGYITGGIKFYDQAQFLKKIKYAYNALMRTVTIPQDAIVYIDNDEYVSDKLILDETINIEDWEIWNDMTFCKEIINTHSAFLKYVKNPTEELIKNTVTKDSFVIECVKNPSDEICLLALENSPYAFRYIKRPSELICMRGIHLNVNNICTIPEDILTPEMCSLAINIDPLILRFIKNKHQTIELCLEAVKLNAGAIIHVENVTAEFYMEAIKINPFVIRHINAAQLTFEMYFEAVTRMGILLKFVPTKWKTEEMCKVAVINDGLALKYCRRDYTDEYNNEIEQIAFQNNPKAIEFIKNITNDMIKKVKQEYPELLDKIKLIDKLDGNDETLLSMVQKVPSMILNIDNPKKELILEALSKNGLLLKSLKLNMYNENDSDIYITAVKNNPNALEFIENPTGELCNIALELDGLTIKHIKKPSLEQCITAINQNYNSIKYIKNPSDVVARYAICKNSSVILIIDNPTCELYKLALSREPDLLNEVRYRVFELSDEQCDDIILTTLRKNGNAVQYLYQGEEKEIYCMEAIKNNPMALEYISVQTEQLCDYAYQLNPLSFKFAKNASYELCLRAVYDNHKNMRYIRNKDNLLYNMAILIDSRCVTLIPDLDKQYECLEMLDEIEKLKLPQLND